MKWNIGIGICLLLTAWYALASIQSNVELDYTVYHVAIVVLLLICAVAGIVLVGKSKSVPGGPQKAWAIIGVWAILIAGGELLYRYCQSQEALRSLNSIPIPTDAADYDSYAARRDRILDRMGPFVSQAQKRRGRDKSSDSPSVGTSNK